MATRYCGRVRLNVTYRDRSDDYRVTASKGGRSLGSVVVRPPASGGGARDSEQAYTSTARAAVSFMSSDRNSPLSDEDLDFTDQGPRITTQPVDRLKISIRKVPLNRQGYTSRGRYFGVGAPLYIGEVMRGDRYVGEAYVRAPNRGAAAAQLRDELKRKGLLSP